VRVHLDDDLLDDLVYKEIALHLLHVFHNIDVKFLIMMMIIIIIIIMHS
jgi:hypothetical protein